jgi:hypothetical protein
MDWVQYNQENPGEDVPPGWVPSDEESSNDEDSDDGYSSDEDIIPPAQHAHAANQH